MHCFWKCPMCCNNLLPEAHSFCHGTGSLLLQLLVAEISVDRFVALGIPVRAKEAERWMWTGHVVSYVWVGGAEMRKKHFVPEWDPDWRTYETPPDRFKVRDMTECGPYLRSHVDTLVSTMRIPRTNRCTYGHKMVDSQTPCIHTHTLPHTCFALSHSRVHAIELRERCKRSRKGTQLRTPDTIQLFQACRSSQSIWQ